jgi:hypothetical protein
VAIDFTPKIVNLNLYAGDGAVFMINVNGDSGPVDITGTVAAQVKPSYDGATAAAFAVDLTNAASGVIKLSMSGVDTASLVNNGMAYTGVWDCQWTASGAQPKTLVCGSVKCYPDVTE